MPKAKGKTRRQKFGYNVNRKRLNRNARRKAAPRIECSHIRHAWDHAKSVRQNLAEMGLAVDPNRAVPLRKRKVKAMEVDIEERPKELVRKPYVLNDLEAEASLPEKKGNTLSRDLIDYVRYMVENHGEDYKSGKTSLILCRRIRWRLSDWFTSQLPQAKACPGPVKLESGCKARRAVWLQRRWPGPMASESYTRTHTHTHTPCSGEGTVLRGSNLYSSGGSWKSQNLLFFQGRWFLYIVCT
ncbi:PREDICTED: nucleolar protein 16 isoform X2 [Colobus angolensis palliatus]|uniref:nucleolar protein 16 isoform X2 n=1 Tax=Colobus angolensis palliatus TaxID=336983 RepID=UPI0005F4342C|nr:PREDICTED: nucleolar protein 16 isoform X2 [Colobus angolensis palliatus]